MIKIICDSISDLPKEIIEKYDVDVVPVTVIFNGIEYIDGVDITNKEFYKMLRETKVMPKTSQVTYAQFDSVFSKYRDEDVIYIAASSSASGTYQSAMIAKEDGHDNVRVFDTQNVSIGSGLFVIKACEMKEKGYSAQEILDNLELMKNTEEVLFSVDTLEYLKMGGRISATKANIGNLLSIKPILGVEDGLVVQKSQVRGKKHVYNSLIEGIIEKYGNDLTNRDVIIGCGDNEEDLEIMRNKLTEKAELKNVYFVNIGCGVCSHSGPGIVGISVL